MAADAVLVRLERAVTTLEDHGRRLTSLEDVRPAVLAAEVRELREDIAEVRAELRDVRDELKANRRSLYTVALSVAGGAITFAFTAFQIWGTTP